MSSRRTAKIAQAIRETVSSTILFGLKDPRVKNVTVIDVEVSSDVRSAKIYVSILGDEREQSLCMHGLNSARGYLQSKVADRVQTRYTPILKFILDEGVKKSIEASRILKELQPPRATTDGEINDEDDEEVQSTPIDPGNITEHADATTSPASREVHE